MKFDVNVGALISIGVALVTFGATLLLVLEAYLLANGLEPITAYTRNAILKWPGQAIAIVGVLLFASGALFAHFFWDAGCS